MSAVHPEQVQLLLETPRKRRRFDVDAFPDNSWVVHKFGGTSVGSADCMRKCVDIVRPITKHARVAVVVSAMGGKPKVTDLLLDIVHAAADCRTDEIRSKMQEVHDKHQQCVNSILQRSPDIARRIMALIEKDLKDITDLLKAVQLMRVAHEQILELVSGYGEIWSANIMAEVMRQEGLPFVFLNARDVLFVCEQETIGTKVFWEESEKKLKEVIAKEEEKFLKENSDSRFADSSVKLPHVLITGYIASTINGVATTLKRDGSDFSASIFGKMLQASSITIWTDVNGVYSADPRRVPEAQIIPVVSYNEAIELAYFGAKVIHPKTMAPAIMAKIPIFIRNTFEPEHEGTRIFLQAEKGQYLRQTSVCGFTTVDNIALFNLEGTGMIGVPGIAHRLFGALKTAHISVMFIAQASSEHSICFATKSIHLEKAKQAIEEAFYYELKQGYVTDIKVVDNCAIIAAIGDGMSQTIGVSGLFFGALGGASINILSISQGCNERNISAVVYSSEATKALRAVHAAFWLSSLDISIGIVGTGRVGSALIQTILEQRTLLESRFGIKINIRGVANSRKMLLGEDLTDDLKNKMTFFSPRKRRDSSDVLLDSVRKSHSNVSLEDLAKAMSEDGDDKLDTDLAAFLDHVKGGATPHSIIIDASTSNDVACLHPSWLNNGCHVVTANKRAIGTSLELYNEVFTAVRSAHRMYMSEVTIGASLPIRTTLNDILCSGDAVHSIVGIMSVSSGMILTDICDYGKTFTEAVRRTYELGLFEDDAFKDLEGTEAAEKLLILAREMGFPIKLEDIEIEPLASKRDITSWSELGETFAAEDERLRLRAEAAKAKGCTLRYIQRIQCFPPAELGKHHGSCKVKATVKLEDVPLDSPHAMVKGPLYHFSFHTARYAQAPLTIQGPLSDSANTASGMLGDLLRIARSMGAKDRGPEEFELLL